MHTTSVSSSRPRSSRSSTSAEKPAVELGQLLVEALEDLGVMVPAAVVDRHEPHARPRPAGGPAGSVWPNGVAAVAVAELVRSPARWRTPLRASPDRTIVGGPLLELVVGRDLVVALDLLRPGRPRPRAASRGARRCLAVSASAAARSWTRKFGCVRVAGLERLVPAAEERALAQLPGERRVPRHRDVRRQRAA